MRLGFKDGIIAVLVVLLLLSQMCRKKTQPCNEVIGEKKEVTVTPHEVKGSDTSKPTLVKTEKPTKPLPPNVPEPIIIKVPDTAGMATLRYIIDSLQNGYNEIYALYTNQNEYWDGVELKDSTGKNYGFVLVKDTLAANQIIGRGYSYQLNFSDTTRTITKYIEQQRLKFLVGGGLYGTQSSLFNQYELNIGIQGKKNLIILVGAGKQQGNNNWIGSLHLVKPISFRKK